MLGVALLGVALPTRMPSPAQSPLSIPSILRHTLRHDFFHLPHTGVVPIARSRSGTLPRDRYINKCTVSGGNRMCRRAVSVLLLPCLLLSQTAAVAHFHAGQAPANHALRPHAHTNRPSARHETHGHHHHGHHHHAAGGHHHDNTEAPTTPVPPEPLSDHDGDAVYIGASDLSTERVQTGDGDTRGPFGHLVFLSTRPQDQCGPREHSALWPHPPPSEFAPDRPLYLRHLALLI